MTIHYKEAHPMPGMPLPLRLIMAGNAIIQAATKTAPLNGFGAALLRVKVKQ